MLDLLSFRDEGRSVDCGSVVEVISSLVAARGAPEWFVVPLYQAFAYSRVCAWPHEDAPMDRPRSGGKGSDPTPLIGSAPPTYGTCDTPSAARTRGGSRPAYRSFDHLVGAGED
jgi:hypothetical protein